MIDKRELLSRARERKLNLNIIEKDYVLGWLLFGFSKIDSLVFKGGTALSKIYFPEIWRLSEDLDFSLIKGDFSDVFERAQDLLALVTEESGIPFNIKSRHSNPHYLQLKIQYNGPIGRNFVKVDFMKNDLVDQPVNKSMSKSYSDYRNFKVKVESINEIFCSKLRTVIERKKCRDFFDLWQLTKLRLNFKRIREILPEKLKIKGLKFSSRSQIFPRDIKEIIGPFWERELGRLVDPLPEMDMVLKELSNFIERELAFQ